MTLLTLINSEAEKEMKREYKFVAAAKALGSLVVGEANPLTGWPGILVIATSSGDLPIALHVSSISSHSRRSYEKRFQNPANASPVTDEKGALPILVGLDNDVDPSVFVAVDGRSRTGRRARFSILFHDHIIQEAKAIGWSTYESSTGERVYAFIPSLLPVFVEQLIHDEILPGNDIVAAAISSGVLDKENSPPEQTFAAKRASKVVNVLVRKAGAGRKIKSAYGNECAMCGLGLNLLEGAHILPVEAPGATDEIWNGIALCRNHHSAFDNHLIWIDPNSYELLLHPIFHETATMNAGTQAFITSTYNRLALPVGRRNLPRPDMFVQRYEYFSEKYKWVKASK